LHDSVGTRSVPVEPSRTELKNKSICPWYSEEYDRYNWTTDEGRCIYEFFKDRFVYSVLPRTVLEMGVMQGSSALGANHSYAFQYGLGWKTILIEANPEMEQHIRNNRPGATLHIVLVCSKPTTLHFVITSAVGLNGFEEFMDEREFQQNMKDFHGQVCTQNSNAIKPMTVLLPRRISD